MFFRHKLTNRDNGNWFVARADDSESVGSETETTLNQALLTEISDCPRLKLEREVLGFEM